MSLYLTSEELLDTTGLSQAAAQIRWLQKNGIRHFIRADGKPRVPRAAIESDERKLRRKAELQPDFDAVRAGH